MCLLVVDWVVILFDSKEFFYSKYNGRNQKGWVKENAGRAWFGLDITFDPKEKD